MLLQPDRAVLLPHLLNLGQVVVGASNDQRATMGVVGVDPFGFAHSTDVIDRIDHRQRDCPRRLPAVPFRHHRGADREVGHAPTTVAARRAEAGDLPLHDQHIQ